MDVSLLRRRSEKDVADSPAPEVVPRGESSHERALDRLDRWIESGCASSVLERDGRERAALASPADRAGKGALRLVAAAARKESEQEARARAGRIARAASVRVARLFAERGERRAVEAFSRIPQRTLVNLAGELPARVEAHILEHTREIVGKASHTQFARGTSIEKIVELATTTVRSGARPMLSVADNGALAFVFEHEFPRAIGKDGEKILRVVVDAEGRVVTAFPVEAAKRLASVTVRGISVAAKLAVPLFVSGLAEREAHAATEDARAARAKANETSWIENALAFLGPYGILESSPIALEPNFAAISRRAHAALDEAQKSLGRAATADEGRAIRQCIYDIWAKAAAGVDE